MSGGGALNTVDKGRPSLGTDVMVDPNTGYETAYSRNDDVNIILECVGVSSWDISDADRSFLYDTNLSVMIKITVKQTTSSKTSRLQIVARTLTWV